MIIWICGLINSLLIKWVVGFSVILWFMLVVSEGGIQVGIWVADANSCTNGFCWCSSTRVQVRFNGYLFVECNLPKIWSLAELVRLFGLLLYWVLIIRLSMIKTWCFYFSDLLHWCFFLLLIFAFLFEDKYRWCLWGSRTLWCCCCLRGFGVW